MKETFWNKRWKRNEVGNQSSVNPLLLKHFGELSLKPKSKVFVPLCGKSIDMLWLMNQGYHVVGVEGEAKVCVDFFAENEIPHTVAQSGHFIVYQGKQITLLQGNFFHLSKELLGPIDAVYDRAALIALPTETRRRYAKMMINLLEQNTSMFLITDLFSRDEIQGPPYSVEREEVLSLYGSHFRIHQVCDLPIENIPDHIRREGAKNGSTQLYLGLFFKKPDIVEEIPEAVATRPLSRL